MLNKSNIIMMLSASLMMLTILLFYYNIIILLEIPFITLMYTQMFISLNLDWLSLMFMSIVLFISSMIIKFSFDYIPYHQHKFFVNLLLMFVLSMNMLIISDNIIFMLLGWDGLGLSSYILVVYYQNSSSSASGSITILSNRIGDIMILMSIASLFFMLSWNFNMNEHYKMMIMLMLMIAAMSKSAQFPFSAWLPAAMSAPTPISALVHSSTLVTAGVYMLIRLMNFNHPMSMFMLMMISSFTAMYASLSALWEQDLKKIIALSTLSQMAMMMFAISLNSTNMAYFHLISHALFKSMMFLCAGIMIHNFMYQDMRHMKSTLSNSPIIFSMMGIASMSLIGIPFMSGFFSKDSIIEKINSSNIIMFISMLMIFSISFTSMYSFRMSLMMSKFSINSNKNIMIPTKSIMEFSILMMFLFPILFGSMYMWMFLPNQLFILPKLKKFLIMLSLLSGTIMIFSFSFKNLIYTKFGKPAISLWFTHMMSSNSLMNSNNFMNQSKKNDKYWNEMYGPNNSFYLFSNMSMFPSMILLSSLCLIMLSFIIPMISYI